MEREILVVTLAHLRSGITQAIHLLVVQIYDLFLLQKFAMLGISKYNVTSE